MNLAYDSNDSDHIAEAAENVRVRLLGLFEGVDEYGLVTPMLGTAQAGPNGDFGPLAWDAPTTERPLINTTEQWDMFNFTADSHPIHLHLTQFQVVEKREIFFQDEENGGEGDGIPDDNPANGEGISYRYLDEVFTTPDYTVADIWIGHEVQLRPEETGWQDTAWVDPHQMLSIVETFDKPGDYVWHCHILSHEDNEMMRPFTVVEDVSQFA